MGAYIVPDWLTIIAGLVIYQRRPEVKVLFGIRSGNVGVGQWCLPTGLGSIRRDTSDVLAEAIHRDTSADFSESLKDPMSIIRSMSPRHQQAFSTLRGFALAEAQWYVEISSALLEQLVPLKPICQFDNERVTVKAHFALEWHIDEPPKPAKTVRPFKEIKFFSREELKGIPIAFGCDKDLEEIFW